MLKKVTTILQFQYTTLKFHPCFLIRIMHVDGLQVPLKGLPQEGSRVAEQQEPDPLDVRVILSPMLLLAIGILLGSVGFIIEISRKEKDVNNKEFGLTDATGRGQ